MRIDVHNKRRNPRVDSYVRGRLDLLVGRYADRIRDVAVQVTDENADKGGEDKVCSIDINLMPRGRFRVSAKHQNVYSAVVKAIHRAEKVVARAVKKSQASRRMNLSTSELWAGMPDVQSSGLG